jgi:hypothetical protein
MLRRMIGIHKTSWNMMLFSALWAYRTSVKSATGFTPFRLVYGVEVILLIECEIPSLKLDVELLPNTSAEEEHILYLMRLDETQRDATLVIETQKKRVKAQYDKHVKPRVFSEGDLVLLYEQDRDVLGDGKFEPMWRGPYIVRRVLEKGAYELVDYDGIPLSEPKNGLYLKKYYAYVICAQVPVFYVSYSVCVTFSLLLTLFGLCSYMMLCLIARCRSLRYPILASPMVLAVVLRT